MQEPHLGDGLAEEVQDGLTQLLQGEPLDGCPERPLTLLVPCTEIHFSASPAFGYRLYSSTSRPKTATWSLQYAEAGTVGSKDAAHDRPFR